MTMTREAHTLIGDTGGACPWPDAGSRIEGQALTLGRGTGVCEGTGMPTGGESHDRPSAVSLTIGLLRSDASARIGGIATVSVCGNVWRAPDGIPGRACVVRPHTRRVVVQTDTLALHTPTKALEGLVVWGTRRPTLCDGGACPRPWGGRGMPSASHATTARIGGLTGRGRHLCACCASSAAITNITGLFSRGVRWRTLVNGNHFIEGWLAFGWT